jgi:hypothetical protein
VSSASLCYYHAAGEVLGPIEVSKLRSLWEAGDLPDDALGHDHLKDEWLPLDEFLKRDAPPAAFKPIHPANAALRRPSRPRSSSSMRLLRRWQVAWILTLLVGILAAIALHFRASHAVAGREARLVEIEELRARIADRDAVIERLRSASREILDPAEIQGRVFLRTKEGAIAPQPGMKVTLHPRRDVERHIESTLSGTPENPAATLATTLPFPVATTTTDSNGFYHIRLPAPGEYILHTNMLPARGPSAIWFVSFDSTAKDHSRVDLTDANMTSNFTPGLVITPAR